MNKRSSMNNKRSMDGRACIEKQILRYLLSFCLALVMIFTMNSVSAFAAEDTDDNTDVKVEITINEAPDDPETPKFTTTGDTRLFSTGMLNVRFHYAGHTEEEISVELSKKKAADVYIGSWSGDYINIAIIPKQNKTLYLTATCGGETIRIKLFLKKEKERTAEEIYSSYSGAMVEIKALEKNSEYTGAGFFIGDRIILTNYHVIEYALGLEIHGYDGKEYRANRIIAVDRFNDIAIIGVREKNNAAFDLCYDRPVTGETVYAIGSPLKYTGSFSDGMVSVSSRIMDGIDYIQMTNAVSTGSGGGPLINSKGEVVGITTLTVPAAQNVNFALPVSYVREMDMSEPEKIAELYKENKDKVRPSSSIVIIIQ